MIDASSTPEPYALSETGIEILTLSHDNIYLEGLTSPKVGGVVSSPTLIELLKLDCLDLHVCNCSNNPIIR